jgi:hypothetical protein
MEREVRPLIRSWKVRTIEHGGRRYRLFENGDAARDMRRNWSRSGAPRYRGGDSGSQSGRVISVGFAGALDGFAEVGDVLEPRTVINAADGVRTEVGSGEGTLVSSATVAGKEQKIRLGKAYGASAVDMEAAAVAQGAQARGVEFAALKAISDAPISACRRWIALWPATGPFAPPGLRVHVALRPWLWGTTIALARNSSKASHALCGALVSYLARERTLSRDFARRVFGGPNCKQRRHGPECAGAHTRTGTQSHTKGLRGRSG